ncbi:MAG: hypothetical protein J7L23_00240 [Candidatus Diapherotrites archaeon]|nr:hypothetical protein [Candidatus Diapherotrites archaeon]
MIPGEIPKSQREVAVSRAKTIVTLNLLHDLTRREFSNKLVDIAAHSGDISKEFKSRLRKRLPKKSQEVSLNELRRFFYENPQEASHVIDNFEQELLKTRKGADVRIPFYKDLKQLRRGLLHMDRIQLRGNRMIENLIKMEEEMAGRRFTAAERKKKKQSILQFVKVYARGINPSEKEAAENAKSRLLGRVASSRFGSLLDAPAFENPSSILSELNHTWSPLNGDTDKSIRKHLEGILSYTFKSPATNKKARETRS